MFIENDHPRVSVITPVYKAEKYIHRCVHSVLSQTFNSFEMLLVDDGSPDNSGFLCDELSRLDSRIKVFHKKNGGASSARNVALDHAVGDYVLMLDSDDWLDFSCLATCVKIADENQLDFIDFGHRNIDDFGFQKGQSSRQETPVLDLNDYVNHSYSKPLGSSGSFYKRSIIGNIRYDEGMIANEDVLFCIKVLSHAQRLKVIPYIFYNIYENDNSITHQSGYYKLQYEAWDAFNKVILDYPDEKRWFDEHALIVLNDSLRYKVDSLRNIFKKYRESHVLVENIKRGNSRHALIASMNLYFYAFYFGVHRKLKEHAKKMFFRLLKK